jgi:HK97 gp10 family phage protein
MSIRAIVTFVSGRSQFEGEAAKAISRAVQKGVAIMEANIKKNTPVQTGTLRRSIHSQMTGMFSGAAFSSSTEGGKEVSYAKHVEYGTRNMAPRAMFRKGVAQSEDKIKSLITGEMRNVKVNIRLKG